MGELLTVRCSDCTYSSDVALGEVGSGVVFRPMLCLDCRTVVSVAVGHPRQKDDPFHYDDSLEDPPPLDTCPLCSGGQLEEVLAQEVGAGAGRTVAIPCPKCGETLVIESIGIAD